jgi:hypothetical protein
MEAAVVIFLLVLVAGLVGGRSGLQLTGDPTEPYGEGDDCGG